jgi:hyperosmotically inducible protein
MNRDVFQGKWKQLRGMVKEKWGNLTDDDVDKVEGQLDRLSGLLQERYGYARQQAEKEIDAWMKEMESTKKVPMGHAMLVLALLLPALGLFTACKTPDAALTAEVKSKMAADSTVPATRINVDTKNKVVTLTGNLDNQAQKDRALEIARSADGVVNVVDMLSVRTGTTTGNAPDPNRTLGERIDDAAITASVKTRFLDDPVVKGLNIDVDTRDGIVFLTGTVHSQTEKDRAMQLARETDHVREVKADLMVRG